MRFIDRGLLIEIGKRIAAQSAAPEAQRTADEAAADLRSIFTDHPKQAAFFRRDRENRKRATTKTRRAGATVGGVREFLARAIEQPGWRGTYVTTTSDEAHDRAWSNDAGNGFAQVLRRLGTRTRTGANGQRTTVETVSLGGVNIELRVGDLKLVFSNGSEIDLYGVNTLSRIDIKRGNAKHAFWVDEAQNFPNLDVFFKEVVTAAIAETLGEVWITGTPGRDCAGFFYEITADDEGGVAGWAVHVLAATDNPFFGRVVRAGPAAAVVSSSGAGTPSTVGSRADGQHDSGPATAQAVQTEEAWFVDDNLGVRHGPYETRAEADEAAHAIRWENAAGREIRENEWKLDDPHVQREFFGKWVKSDARFVFPVHALPDHVLLYAPQRLRPNGYRAGHAPWLDMDAALADLPINRRARRAYQWMFAIGADFGYHPDPFALVVWAFTHELPDVYELFSWKQTEVNTDDQGQYMKALFDGLPNVVSFVGDVDGKQDNVEVWMSRLALPIEPAKKHGKNMLEELLANDVRKGVVHFRGERHGKRIVGSPLLTEMLHLVYLPTKPGKQREVDKHRKVAGVAHGDHACFVAGTMIMTSDGERAIETLRPGDEALTRAGLRRILAAWCTGVHDLWRLETDDGRVLIGTGNHPVWVDGGWLPLSGLMPGDMLTAWENGGPQRSLSSTEGGIGDTRTRRIGHRASTSHAPQKSPDAVDRSACIEPFGSTVTARFPAGTTCTTETGTRSITTFPTSSSKPVANTSECTVRSRRESWPPFGTWNAPVNSPPCGTAAMRAGAGTPNMLADPQPNVLWSALSASNAETGSRPRTSTPSSAATPASRRTEETAASTTSSEYARNASRSSSQASTSAGSAAHTRVRRVVPLGIAAPVYNLTVDGEHEYFANGVLVSNCDAGRYSFADLTHFLHRAPPGAEALSEIERGRREAEAYVAAVDKAEERRRSQEDAEWATWGPGAGADPYDETY